MYYITGRYIDYVIQDFSDFMVSRFVKATVSEVFEDLFKGPQILVLEYLRSSNTPETVAFIIP